MKKKRILLVLSSLPEYGGEHQYSMTVAEYLVKNAVKFHYEIIAVCSNYIWWKWCSQNNVKYYAHLWEGDDGHDIERNINYPHLSRFCNTFFSEEGKWLRKEKIDLIFCLMQGQFIPGYYVKSLRPVHDIMHRYEARFNEIACSYQEREKLFQFVAAQASTIIVESKLGKRQFEESYIRARRRKNFNIEVLPYTVPDYIYCDEKSIDVPEKFIFYPAQFWQHKNHMNLLRAINILKPTIKDIHLVLVGSERNSLSEIKKYINENGIESHISIKGYVSNEQMVYLYKRALGMIMPSFFGPTNIPPLEAMVLGCPVAVANNYAMPEQVGDAGLQFDPEKPDEIADCIARLWKDTELRKKLSKAGIRRMKKWTNDDFEEKLMKIVLDML